MNIFEKNIEAAAAQLSVAKIRLKLFNYGLKLDLGRDNAEKLAESRLFHSDTKYRAMGHREFSTPEAFKIDAMLNQIDALNSQIHQTKTA